MFNDSAAENLTLYAVLLAIGFSVAAIWFGTGGGWKLLLGPQQQRKRFTADDLIDQVVSVDGDVTLFALSQLKDVVESGAMRPAWSTKAAVARAMHNFMRRFEGKPMAVILVMDGWRNPAKVHGHEGVKRAAKREEAATALADLMATSVPVDESADAEEIRLKAIHEALKSDLGVTVDMRYWVTQWVKSHNHISVKPGVAEAAKLAKPLRPHLKALIEAAGYNTWWSIKKDVKEWDLDHVMDKVWAANDDSDTLWNDNKHTVKQYLNLCVQSHVEVRLCGAAYEGEVQGVSLLKQGIADVFMTIDSDTFYIGATCGEDNSSAMRIMESRCGTNSQRLGNVVQVGDLANGVMNGVYGPRAAAAMTLLGHDTHNSLARVKKEDIQEAVLAKENSIAGMQAVFSHYGRNHGYNPTVTNCTATHQGGICIDQKEHAAAQSANSTDETKSLAPRYVETATQSMLLILHHPSFEIHPICATDTAREAFFNRNFTATVEYLNDIVAPPIIDEGGDVEMGRSDAALKLQWETIVQSNFTQHQGATALDCQEFVLLKRWCRTGQALAPATAPTTVAGVSANFGADIDWNFWKTPKNLTDETLREFLVARGVPIYKSGVTTNRRGLLTLAITVKREGAVKWPVRSVDYLAQNVPDAQEKEIRTLSGVIAAAEGASIDIQLTTSFTGVQDNPLKWEKMCNTIATLCLGEKDLYKAFGAHPAVRHRALKRFRDGCIDIDKLRLSFCGGGDDDPEMIVFSTKVGASQRSKTGSTHVLEHTLRMCFRKGDGTYISSPTSICGCEVGSLMCAHMVAFWLMLLTIQYTLKFDNNSEDIDNYTLAMSLIPEHINTVPKLVLFDTLHGHKSIDERKAMIKEAEAMLNVPEDLVDQDVDEALEDAIYDEDNDAAGNVLGFDGAPDTHRLIKQQTLARCTMALRTAAANHHGIAGGATCTKEEAHTETSAKLKAANEAVLESFRWNKRKEFEADCFFDRIQQLGKERKINRRSLLVDYACNKWQVEQRRARMQAYVDQTLLKFDQLAAVLPPA